MLYGETGVVSGKTVFSPTGALLYTRQWFGDGVAKQQRVICQARKKSVGIRIVMPVASERMRS